MEVLINLIVQAGPMIGALVGLYMAIRIDIAKIMISIEHVGAECRRIDAELVRVHDSLDRCKTSGARGCK